MLVKESTLTKRYQDDCIYVLEFLSLADPLNGQSTMEASNLQLSTDQVNSSSFIRIGALGRREYLDNNFENSLPEKECSLGGRAQ